jgi:exo-beta-1,3-glucanase (GH17 family)
LSSVHGIGARQFGVFGLAELDGKANASSVTSAPPPLKRFAIGPALAFLALTVAAVVATWWRLGAPVELPPSPLSGADKFYCVSYAPYRGAQNPLVEGTLVPAWQVDQDLALIAKYSKCVRTYSVDDGLDHVLASARKYGLKVLQGVWISNKPEKNRRQIATAIALAKQYPDVVAAVVVGNEVLLRGEMSATDLMAAIREVKAQVPEPVTYADVWEFWLRYPDVQNAVDFVTIHILPYWEDFPIPAKLAAAHVAAIRAKVGAAMPGKEILIGEFGWPAEGRMREGARPSPANQALAISETLALAQRQNFRVNVIEAFDQSWKRALEGAAGGYWGVFDRATGGPKFTFGAAVSDHPQWRLQALAGALVAVLAFAGAFFAARGKGASATMWGTVAALSFLPAVLFGWTMETVPIESFSIGSWLRSLAFAAVAGVTPIVCAGACAAGRGVPSFAALLGRRGERPDIFGWLLGGTLIAVMLLALEAALGLVFDPRYRDIPFAPATAAVVPYLVVLATTARRRGTRALAETVAAIVLAVAAVYIAVNESFANWQALWFAVALLGLAIVLERARELPSRE